MALYSKNAEKLIFAPTGTPTTGSPGTQTPNGPASSSTPASAPQFLKHRDGLHRSHLHPTDPIAQFHTWYTAASDPSVGVSHPETCTLSTASLPSGRVSARMVYLKELDTRGFVIYSNFGTSGKTRDLFGITLSDAESTQRQPNPWAALTFWWEGQERQVRVEGRAHRLPSSESQVYYDTRARGSRIGAWSSRQSAVVRPDPAVPDDDGRAQLDAWVAETEERFKGQEQIPVPEFWGGLRIVPERIEFWQGRDSRLHDRFVYDRVEDEDAKWTLERLSP